MLWKLGRDRVASAYTPLCGTTTTTQTRFNRAAAPQPVDSFRVGQNHTYIRYIHMHSEIMLDLAGKKPCIRS